MKRPPKKNKHYLIVHNPSNEPDYTHWSGIAMHTGNTEDIGGMCYGFIVDGNECMFPLESIMMATKKQ